MHACTESIILALVYGIFILLALAVLVIMWQVSGILIRARRIIQIAEVSLKTLAIRPVLLELILAFLRNRSTRKTRVDPSHPPT